MPYYDAIVLGLGAMGSATLYHLARRGARVLGIEQFQVAHDRGSSHGGTRIIRKAYFEHPDYVPLLHRAYDLWSDFEAEAERTFFHRVGLVLFGRPDGAILSGVRLAAETHGLNIERVPHDDLAARFPSFAAEADLEALFEADAGYLDVEDSLRAHVALAQRHGAQVHCGEAVRGWWAEPDGVVVETAKARYSAARLIVCAGPWAGRLLADLHLPLEVRRKVVFWYALRSPAAPTLKGGPVFGFDLGHGFFYGFPPLGSADVSSASGGRGFRRAANVPSRSDRAGIAPALEVKVAEHTGRQVVDDPDAVDRLHHPEDDARVTAFVSRHLPDLLPVPTRHSVCLYTMTPDEHFIVDRARDHPNVLLAAGFSGHGFKFAPIVGSAMADLALHGATDEPIAFLRASRAALANG